MEFKIEAIDHLVLTVADQEATCRFYERALGMEVITFGANRKALRFGSQKLNLHPLGSDIQPKAAHPATGTVDLCLLTSTPIEQVIRHLQSCNVAIELGPVDRTGAVGPIRSVYVRDPDNNLVEIANRTPHPGKIAPGFEPV